MKKKLLVLAFFVLLGNSYAQTNIFPSTGSVGIGTVNPSETLTLRDPNIAYNSTTGIVKLRFDSGGGGAGLGFEKETFNTGGLRFYTQYGFGSMIEKMRISASGFVGIGTVTPNTQLDVSGSVALAGNNSNLDNQNGNIPLSFLENSGKILIGWNRTGGAGETDFIGNQGGGNVGGFAFYDHNNTGSETKLMWLTADGRLMLGNTTGSTGSNKLAVGGGIIAEGVTIKLQGNWPDYIFNKEHRLQSLTEVKSYIDQNHHLPDIPSAVQIEKEGLNLGEMNTKLLKKVEELTLYLIAENKKNADQQKQINGLKKQLKAIHK